MGYMKDLKIQLMENDRVSNFVNRNVDGHHTHKMISSGDGYNDPKESYCERCYKQYDYYYGRDNSWLDKRCRWAKFSWRNLFKNQIYWWQEHVESRRHEKEDW